MLHMTHLQLPSLYILHGICLPAAESPQISTQPQDQMDVVGRAAFSVQVNGTQPLSYRWECNLDGGSEWQLVASRASGDDTNVLVIDHIQKGDEGKYRCVISNPAGEVHSESAKLTVGMLHMTHLQLPSLFSMAFVFLQLSLLRSLLSHLRSPLSHKTRWTLLEEQHFLFKSLEHSPSPTAGSVT